MTFHKHINLITVSYTTLSRLIIVALHHAVTLLCHTLLLFVSHIVAFCVKRSCFCNTFLLLCHTFFFLYVPLVVLQRYPAQGHALVLQVVSHHSLFRSSFIRGRLSVTFDCLNV